jgi:hypothetical protein
VGFAPEDNSTTGIDIGLRRLFNAGACTARVQAPETAGSGFLGYFSPEVRPRMFQGYAAMLRIGGRLVFANRIRPGSETEAIGFSPRQIEKFAARAAQLSNGLPAGAPLKPEDAHRMARSYAQFFRSYPLNGEESVRSLARSSGLRWVDGACVPSARLQAEIDGPSVGDGSDYLFVIMEK